MQTITVAQHDIINAIDTIDKRTDDVAAVTRKEIEAVLGQDIGPSDLKTLVADGLIEIVGKVVTGRRGRPPHIYAATAAGLTAPVESNLAVIEGSDEGVANTQDQQVAAA